jgi:hypothetical protein
MMDSEMTALTALRAAREQRRQELAKLDAAIRQVEALLGREPGAPTNARFAGMKIAEAAALLIKEQGKPLTTRALAETLLEGGLTSTSKNFTMTVYSILNENKKFYRTQDGMWDLSERVVGGET